jgi:hypothetical protein
MDTIETNSFGMFRRSVTRNSFGMKMSLTADALSTFLLSPFASRHPSPNPSNPNSPENNVEGFVIPTLTTTSYSPDLPPIDANVLHVNLTSPEATSTTSISTSQVITPVTLANTSRNRYISPTMDDGRKMRKQRSVSCPDRCQDPIIQDMLSGRYDCLFFGD